jgi:hypothetical protein
MRLFKSLFHPKPPQALVTKFWTWFTENSQTIFALEKNQQKIVETLAEQLCAVHKHLTFEIGPDEGGVREFIVSADGFRDAVPAVEEVVKLAPALPHWKVIAFRQPVKIILTAYYGNVILPPEDVWYSSTPKAGKIDITLYIGGYLPSKKAEYLAATFLLLDHLLGEYIVITEIGAVELDIAPADPPAAGLKPFGELKSEF